MDFQEISLRAISVRKLYEEFEAEQYGAPWTSEEIALGFVGDVGDLAKLVMVESGRRTIHDSHMKLAHELADCLWSVLVLANLYNIDLEKAYLETMNDLERQLSI